MTTENKRAASELILPDCMLEEIFVRLPLETAACCKCVSKHWKSLISSLERSGPPNRTILIRKLGEAVVFKRHNGDIHTICESKTIDLDKIVTSAVVVGGCGGLICKSSTNDARALVFNPEMTPISEVCFDFQPVRRNDFFFLGFGYGTSSQDYQVVKITQSPTGRTTVEIRTLHAPLQSRMLDLPSRCVPFLLTHAAPVTLHGSSHWIALSLKNQNLEIIKFDMETESFIEMPFSSSMPNVVCDVKVKETRDVAKHPHRTELNINGMAFKMGIFQGKVCLLATDSSKVEIWSMMKMSPAICWEKVYESQTSSMRLVLGFTANDELVIRKTNIALFAYDIHRRRYVRPLSVDYHYDPYHQVVTYRGASFTPLRN